MVDVNSAANGLSSPSKPLEIAIIGGGIGGLSLLLGLLQHGNLSIIKPHLYESAPAFSEIGAGVGFGPNSAQAMGIVSPSLKQRFEEIASESDTIIDENGNTRAVWNAMWMGMDGRSEKCPLKAGELIIRVLFDTLKKTVHRARFLDEMIRQLPGGTGEGFVSFKKRCTEIDDLGKGKGVRVHFADGPSVDVDAVVGCDGIKSRVRPILMNMIADEKAANPQFSGKYAYRGLIPMDEAVEAIGEIARRSHMWYGYDGHFVCFPVDKGKTMNVVAFRTKFDGKWESPDWILPATVEEALEDFNDFSPSIKKMVGSVRKPDKWMLFEHPPAKSYCDKDGKICLLGDCAHASTPHQGAGAGMAIEDAAVLSRLLGAIERPDRKDFKAAFRVYDALRRPRTQKLVTTSREAGMLYEFQVPGILDDIEKVRADIDQRVRWIWNVNVEELCQEAVSLLKDDLKSG